MWIVSHMPSGKVILTKSEPPMQRRKTNWKQTYRKIKDKSMKPIPEGCYTTVLYVQLNLLFCGLWELKYMPATLRWCPPLWHPTHPWDFLRFWARCRFKISPRVWGGQLLARSARTVPALFQCLLFFFKSLFTFLSTLHFHRSYPKHLDWSIIISLFSTDPDYVPWPQLTTVRVVFGITHGRRSTFLLLEVNAG